MNKISVLGVKFFDGSITESVDIISENISLCPKEPYHIITANPEILMQINRDSEFKDIAEKAGMITADGIGIIYGSKILGHAIKQRVTGVELLVALLETCEKKQHSVYFLGGDEDTNQDFLKYVLFNYPELNIIGCRNGFFDVNDSKIIDEINKVKPDLLVMAMGSPRSHKWFNANREKLIIKATLDVGGGFDALTGRVKRAPKIIQRINLEWLYRRIQNPERAKRQNDLFLFVIEVIKERLRKEKKYN